MFGSKTILIIDDNAYAAIDLACVVESLGGAVAGPVALVSEALGQLAKHRVDAAIIDGGLRDAASLVRHLNRVGVPYLLHCSSALSNDFAAMVDQGAILYRPVDPRVVMSMLAIQIDKADHQRSRARPLGDDQPITLAGPRSPA